MGDASAFAFEARLTPRQLRDLRGPLWALAAALLFHFILLAAFVVDWKRSPPVEPPAMTVELIQEEPEPEPPQVVEQKKPQPPPIPQPQFRQSGGDPDKAPGQAPKADEPAQAKASEEDQPLPAPPDRKPDGVISPEHKAEPKAKKAPPPTKVPQERAAAATPTPVTLSDTAGEGGGDRYLNTVRDEILAKTVYPSVARALQLKGLAHYVIDVDRKGRLVAVQMTGSSGVGTLDQAGLDAIKGAAPFPPIPDEIPGEPVRLVLSLYLTPESR